MSSNRYRNINELIDEVKALGDWRDLSQRDNFFKVLSKISVLYFGYKVNENGKETRKWYPKEVIDAVVEACKGKFPTTEDAFEKVNGKSQLKQGCPDYSNYLVLVKDALSISLMGERTRIDEIAKRDFGIDVFDTPATQEEVEELISSSKDYLEKIKDKPKTIDKNNAREIQFFGSTLEECVNSLLKFQSRGESVVVDFNGHKLYSADITMDSAFQEVTEKTKAEFDDAQNKYFENLKKEQAEKRAKAIEKIPYWLEKGSSLIYPERLEDWKEYVELSAKEGMYHGMDIDSTIELLEMLENGTLDDAKALIESQGHSGWSYGMVRRNVLEFSKKGPEFWEHTATEELTEETKKILEDRKRENAELEAKHSQSKEKEEQQEEKEDSDSYSELKANAHEVTINYRKYGNTIEAAVKTLEDYKAKGESVVIEFNGHKLYSCDVTMDGAYQEVLGMTKEEHEKQKEEWLKEYREREAKEQKRAQEEIPYWLEKGSSLIYPERAEEWKQCVEARASDLYHGKDLDAAIEVMEMLENGTLNDAKEVLEGQGHSGTSYSMVRNIVFSFSKKGPEFWEHTADGDISPESRSAIEDKKRENAELEELHKSDSTKKVSPERRAEEKEINESSVQKEQLMSEISDIEKQISSLKKTLEEKQSQLNDLDEK